MEFTPKKSLNKENDIITYIQIEQNKQEENNNNDQNNPFNNSPLKYYCSDITEIDKQNENGWTPIYRAIIANNINVLKDLLKFGANPNLQNNIGETPLYLCVDIDNYDAILILLEKNADCNISKKDGTSPLHLATKKKKEKFIKILLEHGANPNLINKLYSQTPMHLAIKNKIGEDILLQFKKNGANIFEIKDRYEKSPYDYAKELNDEKYLNMVDNIFENKEEKKEENLKIITNEIIIKDTNNNNNSISNLNSLFKNMELNINQNDNNFDSDNKEKINEIKENNCLIENNENEVIKEDKDKINEKKEENNIIKENKINNELFDNNLELKENINNNIEEKIKEINKETKIKEDIILTSNQNLVSKPQQQQIYQPKKSIKRKSIKNMNKKIKPAKINKNIIKKELNNEEYSPKKESLTVKGRENNLGLGITLTSSENDIYKSNTVKNMPSVINEPKLSTLSENELLKNIILDTAKKIKSHNNNISSNISLDNKSKSNTFSPINTLKSENDKKNSKFSKTFENGNIKMNFNQDIENKRVINTMNPLDMMNQIITTNSNISNDTQEQIKNNYNINNKDYDLLEYSKSYITNATHLNNTEENNLTNNNNFINNVNNANNNSSNKKNECYKKISYHCGKLLHKNNKEINLNNKFNEIDKENDDEENININDDESFENSDNNENINNDNINSIKYKNLNVINHQNAVSTFDNSKYNSILDNSNNKQIFYNSKTNSNTKYNTYNNDIIPASTSAYNSNSYKENISRNKLLKINSKNNNGQIIGNSISNTTYNSNTNNSSSKKYAKKLAILTELENSKNNNQPIKTSISNLDENESLMKLCSGQNIIPNELSSKLHDWLISCDLLCYYNLLIKNKIYDINEYINDIKTNKKIISYKSIEDLGIKKPGHIYRFLLKIKLDSNMLDPYIYNAIIDKYSRNSLNDFKISMSNSGYRIGCCCFRDSNLRLEKRSINSGLGEYTENNNDIFAFLKKMDLLRIKENFIHNGFDQVEYIMIQMFSEYKFNKDILNEYLHIYSDEDKKQVIFKLYNEKKNLCQEYNIKYDENEDKDIYENYLKDYKDNNIKDGFCSVF